MVSSEFFIDNPSGRTMALELTQTLTEVSTRNISRFFFLIRKRNVPDESCREDTHILWSVCFPEKRRMRFACWVAKAANTHSGHVILLAFPPQQWLHERASMLRCTCTVCLVISLSFNHCCWNKRKIIR